MHIKLVFIKSLGSRKRQ